jgi:hypothetical protein
MPLLYIANPPSRAIPIIPVNITSIRSKALRSNGNKSVLCTKNMYSSTLKYYRQVHPYHKTKHYSNYSEPLAAVGGRPLICEWRKVQPQAVPSATHTKPLRTAVECRFIEHVQ